MLNDVDALYVVDALVFLRKTLAGEEIGRAKTRARHGMISATFLARWVFGIDDSGISE